MKPPAVLGIGERVGITPLGGLVACLYAANPDYVKSKYKLSMLREVENLVAEAVGVNVPFMNPITCVYPSCTTADPLMAVHPYSGYCAFTHKAGIHAKAILNNPSTYEILKPEDFGLTRYVSIGSVTGFWWILCYVVVLTDGRCNSHRLTGWNAVKSRVEQLGLELTDDEVPCSTMFQHYVIGNPRKFYPRSRMRRQKSRNSQM